VPTDHAFLSKFGYFFIDSDRSSSSGSYWLAAVMLPRYRGLGTSPNMVAKAYPGDAVTSTLTFTNLSGSPSAFYLSAAYAYDEWRTLKLSEVQTPPIPPGASHSFVLTQTLPYYSPNLQSVIVSAAAMSDPTVRGGWVITGASLPVSATLTFTHSLVSPIQVNTYVPVTLTLANAGPTLLPLFRVNIFRDMNNSDLDRSRLPDICSYDDRVGVMDCTIQRLLPGETRLIVLWLRVFLPGEYSLLHYYGWDYSQYEMYGRYNVAAQVNGVMTYLPLMMR
jgi:hypothetical protein